MAKITRREALALGGGAVLGTIAGGLGITALVRQSSRPSGGPSAAPRVTTDAWLASRQTPYFIGHRGAGDIAPEHTLISYQTALQQGAEALEISVVMSSDKVLYCLHDLTLNRTTTLTGAARSHTAAELDRAKVRIPRLGSAWVGPNMPAMPRLDAVLEAVAGHAVLCIEAKDDAAYPLMIEAVKKAGLEDALIVKLDASSTRLAEAKKANYPLMAYLGNPEVATAAAIKTVAAKLDPERDSLTLPARKDWSTFLSDPIRRAADTGIPTWAFPVHRRSEVTELSRLGAVGMITPSVGYVSGRTQPLTADVWSNGAISPGELTRDPYSNAFALDWADAGVLGLGFQERQAFVTLGQFAPVTQPSYRLSFDLAFDPLPKDTWQHASIAFAHADDRYYEHRLGDDDGYHALLRADGTMAIYAHVEGDPNGQVLMQKKSAPLKAGLWSRMTLDITPDTISWSRDDGTLLTVKDSRWRGGYFHIGRSSDDGQLNLRGLSIT